MKCQILQDGNFLDLVCGWGHIKHASTQLGLYNSAGNNIIWMDGNGIRVKDTAGTEIMKINPSDGFKLCTANGWGEEWIQIKDAILNCYNNNTKVAYVDFVAQYGNGYAFVLNVPDAWMPDKGAYNREGAIIQAYRTLFTDSYGTGTAMSVSYRDGIFAYVTTTGFSDARAKENMKKSR